MEQYNPAGKVAQLGVQAMSSWLLFAQAATECGSDLTAECLLEQAEAQEGWTGGGLHAAQTPGNDEPAECFLLLEPRRRRRVPLQRGGHRVPPTGRPVQLQPGERLGRR